MRMSSAKLSLKATEKRNAHNRQNRERKCFSTEQTRIYEKEFSKPPNVILQFSFLPHLSKSTENAQFFTLREGKSLHISFSLHVDGAFWRVQHGRCFPRITVKLLKYFLYVIDVTLYRMEPINP